MSTRHLLLREIVAAALLFGWSCQAIADDKFSVCQAIADETNRRAEEVKGPDLYDFRNELIHLLPQSVIHLDPRDISSNDFLAMTDCADASICAQFADALEIGDPDWHLQIVDTRPWSSFAFVYSIHSGRNRGDGLVTLRPGQAGKLVPYTVSDEGVFDSEFEILRFGNSPKIAMTPSAVEFDEDQVNITLAGEYRMDLPIFGAPENRKSKNEYDYIDCIVRYRFKAEPGVDFENMLLQGSMTGEKLLNSEIESMASRFALEDNKKAIVFADDRQFVGADVGGSELNAVRKFLTSAPSGEDLTASAVRAMTAAHVRVFEDQTDFGDPTSWVTRWFPLKLEGHTYATALMQHWPLPQSVIALFDVNSGMPVLRTAYLLLNHFSFKNAEAYPGSGPN